MKIKSIQNVTQNTLYPNTEKSDIFFDKMSLCTDSIKNNYVICTKKKSD